MHRRIEVRVDRHPRGLLYAHSDDLKGLLVMDRSRDRIEEALPGAIKELLEFESPCNTVDVSGVVGERHEGTLRYEAVVRTRPEA